MSRTLAQREWPDETALGKRIKVNGAWRTVVGVAGDIETERPSTDPPETFYAPLEQLMLRAAPALLVRTRRRRRRRRGRDSSRGAGRRGGRHREPRGSNGRSRRRIARRRSAAHGTHRALRRDRGTARRRRHVWRRGGVGRSTHARDGDSRRCRRELRVDRPADRRERGKGRRPRRRQRDRCCRSSGCGFCRRTYMAFGSRTRSSTLALESCSRSRPWPRRGFPRAERRACGWSTRSPPTASASRCSTDPTPSTSRSPCA